MRFLWSPALPNSSICSKSDYASYVSYRESSYASTSGRKYPWSWVKKGLRVRLLKLEATTKSQVVRVWFRILRYVEGLNAPLYAVRARAENLGGDIPEGKGSANTENPLAPSLIRLAWLFDGLGQRVSNIRMEKEQNYSRPARTPVDSLGFGRMEPGEPGKLLLNYFLSILVNSSWLGVNACYAFLFLSGSNPVGTA